MLFFETVPQGRVLNRFSRDTEQIDVQIPGLINRAIVTGFQIIAIIISISILNWPVLIVVIPALIIFLAIFKNFRLIFP